MSDLFPQARVFLLPEEDDSIITKRDIAFHLLKSLALDVDSDFKSLTVESLLRQIIETLAERIKSLEKDARLDRDRLIHQENELNTQLKSKAEAIEVAEGQIAALDTEDHVRLETSIRVHQFKLLSPTPNFFFDMNTKLPVRLVIKEQSASSKWVPGDSGIGTKRYRATLRNKLLKDAFGKVELYTWKRDVHRIQIAEKRDSLEKLRALKKNLDSQVEGFWKDINAINIKMKKYRSQQVSCNSNRQLLDSLYPSPWSSPMALDLYREGNIYGIAKLYGLKGNYPKCYLDMADSDASSETLFETHQSMIALTAKGLKVNRSKLDDLINETNSFRKKSPSFWTIEPADVFGSSLISLSRTANGGEEHEKKIALEAFKLLTSFATSKRSVKEKQSQSYLELETDLKEAEVAQSQLLDLIKETGINQECGEEVLASIRSDCLPIGCLASLVEQSSVEMYRSMYTVNRRRG